MTWHTDSGYARKTPCGEYSKTSRPLGAPSLAPLSVVSACCMRILHNKVYFCHQSWLPFGFRRCHHYRHCRRCHPFSPRLRRRRHRSTLQAASTKQCSTLRAMRALVAYAALLAMALVSSMSGAWASDSVGCHKTRPSPARRKFSSPEVDHFLLDTVPRLRDQIAQTFKVRLKHRG